MAGIPIGTVETLHKVLVPFWWAAMSAADYGFRHGTDRTGYGPGVRCIACPPLMDRWRSVSDPHWPVNWNAHLVIPTDGGRVRYVVPASSVLGFVRDIRGEY